MINMSELYALITLERKTEIVKKKLKKALTQGFDIYTEDSESDTVFSYAVKANNLELVKFIVNEGFDIRKYKYKWVPVAWAFRNNNLEMLKFLLEHGAQLSAYQFSDYKCTDLLDACNFSKEFMLKLIYSANVEDVRSCLVDYYKDCYEK